MAGNYQNTAKAYLNKIAGTRHDFIVHGKKKISGGLWSKGKFAENVKHVYLSVPRKGVFLIFALVWNNAPSRLSENFPGILNLIMLHHIIVMMPLVKVCIHTKY